MNCFENDIQHSVLILYGEYIQYEHTYSINDFMLNNENILKKIQIMTKNEKGKTTYETRYLVITHLYLLIFYPEYLNNHSKVRMSFYGELRTIDFINRVSIDLMNDKYLGKYFSNTSTRVLPFSFKARFSTSGKYFSFISSQNIVY